VWKEVTYRASVSYLPNLVQNGANPTWLADVCCGVDEMEGASRTEVIVVSGLASF
jgi:hypothetical protein